MNKVRVAVIGAGALAGSAEGYVNQGFQAKARAFVDAVKAGTPPHNSPQDVVESIRLADMIYQNAINE